MAKKAASKVKTGRERKLTQAEKPVTRRAMNAALSLLFDDSRYAGGHRLWRRFYVSTLGGQVWAYGDTMEEAVSRLDRQLTKEGQRSHAGKLPTACVLFLATVPFDLLPQGSAENAEAKGLAWAGSRGRMVNCHCYVLW